MSNAVAKRSPAVARMVERAAKQRALMGGSRAMRESGTEYLPKFEGESPESYQQRLKMSWLFNGYRKTVKDMTGKVFAKPVEIEAGPTQIADWAENIDMQGNDLSTFARRVFEDGYDAGISFIWVDAPPRNGVVTLAQVEAENLRPYFVHLPVEDVLGWKSETIGNVTRLTQFRIMETVTKPDEKDEFAQVEIQQVRVLDRTEGGVQTRLFRKGRDAEKWEQVGEPTLSGVPEITVVPFYANRTGFFTGEPILDDLADVNIAHWQSQSDQRHILHFARVPVLFAAGRTEDEPAIKFSAGVAIVSSDPQAKLMWVEHSGAAIGAGRQDLKDLEFQMETFGLQLLVARPGGQSATGEALDAGKETSTLAMTADELQDALEQAFAYMGLYANFGDDVSLIVNREYGVSMMTAQDLTAMLTAVNTGNMSRATFLNEMKRRGMISADVDIEEEAERIADEGGMMDETIGAE